MFWIVGSICGAPQLKDCGCCLTSGCRFILIWLSSNLHPIHIAGSVGSSKDKGCWCLDSHWNTTGSFRRSNRVHRWIQSQCCCTFGSVTQLDRLAIATRRHIEILDQHHCLLWSHYSDWKRLANFQSISTLGNQHVIGILLRRDCYTTIAGKSKLFIRRFHPYRNCIFHTVANCNWLPFGNFGICPVKLQDFGMLRFFLF